MTAYWANEDRSAVLLIDGASVRVVRRGADFEAAVAAGPLPVPGDLAELLPVAGVGAVPTVEDYRLAVQAHLDAVAVSRLYESGHALATYATSTNPAWAAEAQAFIAWRDAVWGQVYALWADPPEPAPTIEALIASLPVIVWPEPPQG